MYTNILHATDLAENHLSICQKALAITERLGGKLYLLHVIETPATLQIAQGLGFAEIDNPQRIREDAKAVLEILGESLGIPIDRQFVEIGTVKHHILEKVKELSCSMVIIGHHTPNDLPLFLGSTAHSVVHETTCDVLTLGSI